MKSTTELIKEKLGEQNALLERCIFEFEKVEKGNKQARVRLRNNQTAIKKLTKEIRDLTQGLV